MGYTLAGRGMKTQLFAKLLGCYGEVGRRLDSGLLGGRLLNCQGGEGVGRFAAFWAATEEGGGEIKHLLGCPSGARGLSLLGCAERVGALSRNQVYCETIKIACGLLAFLQDGSTHLKGRVVGSSSIISYRNVVLISGFQSKLNNSYTTVHCYLSSLANIVHTNNIA